MEDFETAELGASVDDGDEDLLADKPRGSGGSGSGGDDQPTEGTSFSF